MKKILLTVLATALIAGVNAEGKKNKIKRAMPMAMTMATKAETKHSKDVAIEKNTIIQAILNNIIVPVLSSIAYGSLGDIIRNKRIFTFNTTNAQEMGDLLKTFEEQLTKLKDKIKYEKQESSGKITYILFLKDEKKSIDDKIEEIKKLVNTIYTYPPSVKEESGKIIFTINDDEEITDYDIQQIKDYFVR